MKRISYFDILDIKSKMHFCVYNNVSRTYTILNEHKETVAQFDCESVFCTFIGRGCFFNFEYEDLKTLFLGVDVPSFVKVIGGRRARNDAKIKNRNTKPCGFKIV